ncbi:hypothetical protein [Paraferrimonas haliotis]|uniref:Uncharacterized protein n=1 Tax=Paraferrimonas haliotis TaxID=2013866 RepID=A0AA37TXM5_9GAMM|nr:hypothetical protein [Paraferrimonas haliotis]GLS83261.1 hypothetical protein GCM10007894_12380 [Paraferrimonas haliotis]
MSALKNIPFIVKNLITFGIFSRYLKLAKEYSTIYERYESTHDSATRLIQELNKLYDSISSNVALLNSFKKRHRNIIGKGWHIEKFVITKQEPTLLLKAFNSKYNLHTNVAAGAGVGVGTLTGAWLTVGAFGTASTGAAISGLSGIAAFNATLAWFGLGSLAAGGFGMAGGKFILTLALIVITWLTMVFGFHRKLAKTHSKKAEVISELDKLQSRLPQLTAEVATLEKQSLVMAKLTKDYLLIGSECNKMIYPNGVLSKVRQTIASCLGFKRYSKKQYQGVDRLRKASEGLARSLSEL